MGASRNHIRSRAMLDVEDSMRVEYGATEAGGCGDTCGPRAACGRGHGPAEAVGTSPASASRRTSGAVDDLKHRYHPGCHRHMREAEDRLPRSTRSRIKFSRIAGCVDGEGVVLSRNMY